MKSTNDRHEEVPWTASRCQRLLRTITSRLGVLRNLAKHVSQAESIGRCFARDSASPLPGPVHIPAADVFVSSPRTKDPDWIPPHNRKRQCDRTYVGNPKRRKVKTDEKARWRTDQDFHTPFIKRVLASESAQPPIESPTIAVLRRDPQVNAAERKRKCLPTLPTSSADQAYRTLLEAFESILIATKPDNAPSRLGTSSLLRTCLRRIPSYIHLEQSYAENKHETDSSDVTSDIYDHLESFGSRKGGGWKGLRCVIRAHAVSLMQDALNDGILLGEPLDALLAVCSRCGAIEERQSILRSWFESCGDVNKESLNKFITQCVQFGHRSLLLQGFKDVIQRDTKAFRYLSGQPTLWCEVVKAFVATSNRAVASSFCETYIASPLHQQCTVEQLDEQLEVRAIYNANVLLTAFAWKQHTMHNTDDIASSICRWPVHARLPAQNSDQLELIGPFLLSSLALRVTGCQPLPGVQCFGTENTLDLIGERRDPIEVVSKVTDFILKVGKNVLYVDHAIAHSFMRSAVTGLLQSMKNTDRNCSDLCRPILNSISRSWADICDDNESYSLLEEVEYSTFVHQKRDTISSPMIAQRPISYRWEEGLCEWVAKTPSLQDSRPTTQSDDNLGSVHDSGVDLDDESADEKSSRALIADGTSEVANEDKWDDEDELALITPIHQRQKAGRVRFDLQQQVGCCRKRMSNCTRLDEVFTFTENDSDDELAFG